MSAERIASAGFRGGKLSAAGRAETATPPEAIQAVRLLLRNRPDKLVTRFRKTDTEFMAGYRSARVIVDHPGGGSPAKPPPRRRPRLRGGGLGRPNAPAVKARDPSPRARTTECGARVNRAAAVGGNRD